MKIFHISLIFILIILCSAFFGGCNSTTGEEQETFQTETAHQTTAHDSKTENNKMYEYKIEELWCKRGNNNIYGQIYIPKGSKDQKFPAVIVGHGFTGKYDNNSAFAETFAKNGNVTYLFDFCGGSNVSKSDGKTTDMSILTEKEDMLSVFDKIKNLDYVDSDNIFLMGESQGGVVASLCASEIRDNIRGLLLLYPAYSIPDMANELYPDKDSVPEEYTVWGMNLGKVYYADCLTFDVYDEISKYKGPVVIYHGTDDQVVPFSYSEKAVEVYENAKLNAEEGVGHGFEKELQYSTAEDMIKFINENIL